MRQEQLRNTVTSMPWRFAGLLAVLVLSCTLSACGDLGRAVEAKERLAKAQAMFAERCKTAGEKINRRVEDVEGVLLLKVRPEGVNYGDQFALTDPYGADLGGQAYIGSFLRGNYQTGSKGKPAPGSPPRLGYMYVDAIDANDGQRYRFTGRIEEPWQTNKAYLQGYVRFVLDKVPAPSIGPSPRYGVTYDDISTREDREYWIAGSSLKVIDMQTNEVVAERVGYMVDLGQGNNSGGRSPWLHAASHACPTFARNPLVPLPSEQAARAQIRQTQDFVEKVLEPRKEH